MKITYIENSENVVYGVEKKTLPGNKYLLNWKALNLPNYLVLFDATRDAVNLTTEAGSARLKPILDGMAAQLAGEKIAVSKGLTATLLSRNDLLREGGMPVRERPGIYAIYAAQLSQDELTVYIPETVEFESCTITMTMEVLLEQRPHYVEKGFFKKSAVYSGFHQVFVKKAYPGMVGGLLTYSVNGFTFSFPDSVVKNGGSFFVKMAENDMLDFKSGMPGIQIK